MRRFLFALLLFATLIGPQASDQGPLAISISPERAQLEIKFEGRRVLLYAFASNQFKPYVKELYSLAGDNVLLDAPADHLHHHALMYAIRINGVNFWEEVGSPGHERSVKILSNAVEKNRATFSQLVHWATNASASPLLTEIRTISVSVDPAQDELALEWRGDFEVGSTAVQLTGSAYNGLGLRLPESFNHVARHQNSENLPYTAEAKWDVTPGRWSAVTGKTGARESTIALFETPSNAGETRFFTMLNPFTYLSVTQNLEKQPLNYRSGERFSIRYLLTIHSGPKSIEFLQNRHQQWLRDSK